MEKIIMTYNQKLTNEQTVQNLFDGYALEFDSIYGGESRSSFKKMMDRWFRKSMLVRFQKSIEGCAPYQGKRILDIGTGPGHYAVVLAQKGVEKVIGIDFSSSMIEIAKRHAEKHHVSKTCEFLVQDIREFKSVEKFDHAVVMGVMDYIPDPVPFLQHISTLVNGTILLSFPEDDGLMAFQRRLRYQWFGNCRLTMYTKSKLETLLQEIAPGRYSIEKIQRDFFVTIMK